jgi:hypothetical protein
VRRLLAITAALVAVAVLAAVALGKAGYREYGLDPAAPKPACPEDCSAAVGLTAYPIQHVRDGGNRVVEYPTRVRGRNGWLVGFSVTLGNPRRGERTFYNKRWGKPASVRISILDPEPAKKDRENRKQRFRLHNQSEVRDIRPWFGKRVWITLRERMHVRKGQIIALTIPTWAPVLGKTGNRAERWRSSRDRRVCENHYRVAPRQKIGKLRDYRCVYATTRLLYTALVVHKTPENKSR